MSRALVSFVAALVAFTIWMSQMGNPHVAETAMGLIIAGAVWIAVFIALGRRARKRDRRRSVPTQAAGPVREAPPHRRGEGHREMPTMRAACDGTAGPARNGEVPVLRARLPVRALMRPS